MEYTIIGYYPDRNWWALVAPVGHEKEKALGVLRRMITEPTENDKKLIGTATILSLDTVSEKDAWWHDPFLAN